MDPHMGAIFGAVAGFIYPMGRDPRFGYLIHGLRSDLDLDGDSISHQHGMEGLIAIAPGNGNIILEFAGHGFE